jgi:hypothetical protein
MPCQTGFKPFKVSIDMLGAYATAAHDVPGGHSRHTMSLRLADAVLDEAVTAAAAIAGPDTSPVVYERDDIG